MRSRRAIGLLTLATALMAAPSTAHAVTIESLRAGDTVTASVTTTLTDNATGIAIRCTHTFRIPTTAFTGTSSVSIEAANNLYTSCRASDGATCTVRANGRWTLTASSITSGVLRLDNVLTVDCTERILFPYSCVYTVASGQTLRFTFTNPIAPATTGTLRLDVPNTLRYVIDAGFSCPYGPTGTRGSWTVSETLSVENMQIR